jgi:hypothetical protein
MKVKRLLTTAAIAIGLLTGAAHADTPKYRTELSTTRLSAAVRAEIEASTYRDCREFNGN